MKIQTILLCCISWLLSQRIILAQSTYTDYQIQFTSNYNNVLINKITYTPEHTIFYFNIIVSSKYYLKLIGPKTAKSWHVISLNTKDTLCVSAIKNFKKNHEVIKEEILELYKTEIDSQNNVYSLELHFPPLSKDIKEVNLISGLGNEKNNTYLHFYNIKIKQHTDTDLGNETHSADALNKFAKELVPHFSASTKKNNKTIEDKNNPYPIRRLRDKDDLSCNENIVLDKIKFVEDSDEFMEYLQAQKQLVLILDFMQHNPNTNITIFGHTDIFGNPDKNIELSKKRAQKVQFWLNMNGISNKRIKIQWFGITQPLFPQGDSKNRRVEFKLECF